MRAPQPGVAEAHVVDGAEVEGHGARAHAVDGLLHQLARRSQGQPVGHVAGPSHLQSQVRVVVGARTRVAEPGVGGVQEARDLVPVEAAAVVDPGQGEVDQADPEGAHVAEVPGHADGVMAEVGDPLVVGVGHLAAAPRQGDPRRVPEHLRGVAGHGRVGRAEGHGPGADADLQEGTAGDARLANGRLRRVGPDEGGQGQPKHRASVKLHLPILRSALPSGVTAVWRSGRSACRRGTRPRRCRDRW